jgi:hypothetical protein
MDSLVWLISAAFCRLTCAQERQHGVWAADVHEGFDRESPVAQQECALERILGLYTVACQMKNMCTLLGENLLEKCRRDIG